MNIYRNAALASLVLWSVGASAQALAPLQGDTIQSSGRCATSVVFKTCDEAPSITTANGTTADEAQRHALASQMARSQQKLAQRIDGDDDPDTMTIYGDREVIAQKTPNQQFSEAVDQSTNADCRSAYTDGRGAFSVTSFVSSVVDSKGCSW